MALVLLYNQQEAQKETDIVVHPVLIIATETIAEENLGRLVLKQMIFVIIVEKQVIGLMNAENQ